jgi:hypothetical protein
MIQTISAEADEHKIRTFKNLSFLYPLFHHNHLNNDCTKKD